MGIQGRIPNPWMPNGIADNTNSPTPMLAPGELGQQFFDQNTGLVYRRVLLDSGATSATAVGAVKANQLAIWKDETNSIVTNDPNFNDTGTPASFVNRIAGVFRTAVTTQPGVNNSQGQPVQYYCDIVTNGKNVPILALQGSTVVQGAQVIADNGGTSNIGNINSGGGVKTLANVTTAPTQQVLGLCKSAVVSGPTTAPGTILVDVSISFID